MCDDPLCKLTHRQLRKENDRLRSKATEVARLRRILEAIVADLEQRDSIDAEQVLQEAVGDE